MSEAQGRVGRWLRNKWHLDSLIAIGGMAAVYSSTHRNGARAAIKLLHSQYTRNEQARRRFLAEGYAANKVGHRNAVLVLDDDTTEDGEVYLVMELLDGESLEGRLERVGVLGPMEVLELTDQLLDVLSYAHPQGILHRDIKPANIYLTRDGAVKLLDFGLARVRELSAEAMDQSDGIVFGTVSYIAPEQARADNQNLDARSDLWSIAATMFRCLSGETVHPSTGPIIDRLLAVARKPARSIATVCPRLPRPVIELIDRALAFDPETRWPSANVMRVVVQDVLAQLTEEAEAAAEAAGETAEPELELRTSVVFTQRSSAASSRAKTGPDLPRVRPTGPRTPAPQDPPARPRTDPQVISSRPASLPAPSVAARLDDDEVDLDVDALRERPEETRERRSRTLLTKEGRAELRRILDARKAAVGPGEVREEATPTFSANAPVFPASSPAASESIVGDVDVDFEDSLIEVTIDHTRHGRPGPIAEVLADPVTPAPVSAPRPVPEDRPTRQTGGHPTLGARSEPTPGQMTTGSYATLGAPPVTAGRAPITPREAVPEDSMRPRPGTPDDSTRRRAATANLDDSARRRAAAMASLDDTARRRAAAQATGPTETAATPAVPEDRHKRTTASYPTLGGPTSRPFDVSATSARPAGALASQGPRPVSGEIQSGPEPVTDELPRPAPVVISGEIVSGPTRAAEITRVGAPPSGVEVQPANRPAEITRVGPPPAPQTTVRPTVEASRVASIKSGLHETIRPKTIPPVSSAYKPSRPAPLGEPAAPRPMAREVTRPEPAAEIAKKASLGRAGVFAAPNKPPGTSASEPVAQRGASDPAKPASEPARPASASSPGSARPPTDAPRVTSDAGQLASTASASSPAAPRPPTDPPRVTSEASKPVGQRPAIDPPPPVSMSLPQRPAGPAASPRPAGPAAPPTTDAPRPASAAPPKSTGPAASPRPAAAAATPRTSTDAPRPSAAATGRTTLPATKSMFNPYPTRTPVPAADAKDSDADDTGRFAPAKPGSKTAASTVVGMPGPRPTVGRGAPATTPTQPVSKDIPAPTTRPDAPTASQPIVDAVVAAEAEPPRPSTEPRARASAPVLPFSFLRPTAAPARPAAAEEPPKDGDKPRKKP